MRRSLGRWRRDAAARRGVDTLRPRGWLLRSTLLFLAACGAPLLGPLPVLRAEEQRTPLVVIIDADDGPITRRLRQEIEALGFSVQLRTRRPSETASEELSARRAVAVIEIKAARPGSVELSVVDPKTTKIVRRALPIEAAQDPTAAELVATRTVELLRAARLSVRANIEPAREPEEEPRRPAPSLPSARELRADPLFVGAGMGLVFSSGWTLGWSAALNAGWLPGGRFGLVAELSLPLTPCVWNGTEGEGSIDAYANAYRLGAVLQLVGEQTFGLRLSAGAEFSQLWFHGRAEAPYVNTEARLSTWGPWVRVVSGLRATRSLRVVTALGGTWTLPRSAINFAGREVSRWGRPTVTGLMGVEWTFP